MLISKKHLINGYRAQVKYEDEILFDLRQLSSSLSRLNSRLAKYHGFNDSKAFIAIEPTTWEVEVFE